MLYCHNKLKGFTLSEMIIVMVVLGFVAMATVPMLGNKKIMNPKKTTAPHGRYECFYDNNGHLQGYYIDNTENKKGNTSSYDSTGYCEFEPPSANFFIVTAIGAGGNGYVSGPAPSYSLSGYNEHGYVAIGEEFAESLAKAPSWVSKFWDEQWLSPDVETIPKYKIDSPIGSGGRGKCLLNKNTNDPSCDKCFAMNKNLCTENCIKAVKGKCGDSGRGVSVTTNVKLKSKYNLDFLENQNIAGIDFGSSRFVIASSESGKPPEVVGSNIVKQNINGKDLDCNDITPFGENFTCVPTTKNKGAKNGCTPQYTDEAGANPTMGKVTVLSPSISYSYNTPGVKAKVAYSGTPGQVVSEMRTSLPRKIKIMPAKDSTVRNTYVKNKADNSILLQASSGSNASMQTKIFPCGSSGCYPFPGNYLKDFGETIPTGYSELSSAAFTSALDEMLDGLWKPGQGGAGSFPIITQGGATDQTGKRIINGVIVEEYEMEVDSQSELSWMNPCTGRSKSESKERLSENGKYCMGTRGYPGAVVITW